MSMKKKFQTEQDKLFDFMLSTTLLSEINVVTNVIN